MLAPDDGQASKRYHNPSYRHVLALKKYRFSYRFTLDSRCRVGYDYVLANFRVPSYQNPYIGVHQFRQAAVACLWLVAVTGTSMIGSEKQVDYSKLVVPYFLVKKSVLLLVRLSNEPLTNQWVGPVSYKPSRSNNRHKV